MWIVITGNPVKGFNFYGPFETHQIANSWAALCFKHVELTEPQDWFVAELHDKSSVKAEYPLLLNCPDCGPITQFFPPAAVTKYTQHCEGCGRAIHVGSTPPGKGSLFG